jgi:hypothetical protein
MVSSIRVLVGRQYASGSGSIKETISFGDTLLQLAGGYRGEVRFESSDRWRG